VRSTAAGSTVGAALESGARRLARAGVEAPATQALALVGFLLGTDRGGVLVRRREALTARARRRLEGWFERRARREPLQHVIGEQEFLELTLRVDRRALIPRPETEGLVETALALEPPPGARVADLGTGSGCIAVALATRRPDLRLVALDRSPEALALARLNARRHGVRAAIRFVRGDFCRMPRAWHGRMSLVVSNPPYVSEAEWAGLEPEVRDHDPRAALVAGPRGTEAYESLLPAARELLRPGGHIVLELGWGQDRRVAALARGAGLDVLDVRPDHAGIPRVLVARRVEGG